MYASIRKGRVKPGTSVDKVVMLINGGALPILSAISGFESAYIVRGDDDSFVAISVFADKEAAEQSNARILPWLRENLGPWLAGPPDAMVGEVVAHR